MRKGIISLEDLGGLEQTQAVGSDLHITDVEDCVADTISCTDQLQVMSDDVGAGVEVANTLLKIQDNFSTPEELTEAGAKALGIAVEHLCNSIGFKKSPLPALETFSTDKAAYAKLALEGIGDFISRIVKAILEAIKKAIKFIIDFITSFFLSTKSLQKRADALSKEAASCSSSEAGNDDYIESKRLTTFLDTKLGFITNTEFNNAFEKHDLIFDTIFEKTIALTESSGIALKEAYAKTSKFKYGKDKYVLDNLLETVLAPLISHQHTSLKIDKSVLSRYDDNNVVSDFPLIFNNSSFYISLVSASAARGKMSHAIHKAGMFIDHDSEKTNDDIKPIKALSKHDVLAVLGNVKGNLNGVGSKKSKLKKLVSDLEALSSKIASDFRNQRINTYLNADALEYIYSLASVITRFATTGIPSILKYNLVVDKYSLDYVASSIAKLKQVGDKLNADVVPRSSNTPKLLN